ncbi:MAG: hypothetical protein U0W40_08120 [Acidimicrobiia bacterium]
MDIDNSKSRILYGMVAAAGRPVDKIGPHVHVGWEELHPGGWDAQARLAEQDRDGVAVEILYPSVGMILCNHEDADYKAACFDAYNQWLAELSSVPPHRPSSAGQTALRSVEEGIDDLVRMKEPRACGRMMPAGCASWRTATTTTRCGTCSGVRVWSSTSRRRSTSSPAVPRLVPTSPAARR